MKELSFVGKSVPKIDALEKVNGKARYGGDIKIPKMLYGKVLRSPLAHAKLLHIDTSKAERILGVKKIVTGKDIPDNAKLGLMIRDMYFLTKGKVRFVGEPMAAVAGVDRDTAEEALDLIRVDLEELPVVLDPIKAMEPEAPHIHEGTNVCYSRRLLKGDIEKGFQEADFILEDTFKTQMVEHCTIETHAAVAQVDSSGRITVWVNSQAPFLSRIFLSQGLGIPIGKIRVIATAIGGAFGGKNDLLCDPYCVMLALRTGLSVKVEMTRQELFTSSHVKHPAIMEYKTGVKRDGEIVARKGKIILDTGAYCDVGDYVLTYSVIFAGGPYHIPNLSVEGYLVYTNKQICAAMRGFGNTQVCFAYESQMDEIAKTLGLDPLELRLKNALKDGDEGATGIKLRAVGLKKTMEKVAQSWLERKKIKGRGMGIASMHYTSGALGAKDYTGVFLKMNEDGTVHIFTGVPDQGQGVKTVAAQIAAEELGIFPEDVIVSCGDTDSSPLDFCGANASRFTYLGGNAVKKAASEAKNQLIKLAAQILEASPEDMEIKERMIYVKGSPEKRISIAEVAMMSTFGLGIGKPIRAEASYNSESHFPDEMGQGQVVDFYLWATHMAEVAVDHETGEVQILNFIATHDCGKAINPLSVEGQIQGAAAMGIGLGLFEEIVHNEKGRTINPSFKDYRVPTALDLPTILPIIVEEPEPKGPYGARGVGEGAIIPAAPSIANALYNAVGVRIKELPLTPEKIYNALKS